MFVINPSDLSRGRFAVRVPEFLATTVATRTIEVRIMYPATASLDEDATPTAARRGEDNSFGVTKIQITLDDLKMIGTPDDIRRFLFDDRSRFWLLLEEKDGIFSVKARLGRTPTRGDRLAEEFSLELLNQRGTTMSPLKINMYRNVGLAC
jgi:hypothetical protein